MEHGQWRQGLQPPFQSALTYFLFGLIAGYNIVYYIGLFVHTRDKKPETAIKIAVAAEVKGKK